jgi:hypothetical protein
MRHGSTSIKRQLLACFLGAFIGAMIPSLMLGPAEIMHRKTLTLGFVATMVLSTLGVRLISERFPNKPSEQTVEAIFRSLCWMTGLLFSIPGSVLLAHGLFKLSFEDLIAGAFFLQLGLFALPLIPSRLRIASQTLLLVVAFIGLIYEPAFSTALVACASSAIFAVACTPSILYSIMHAAE